MTFAHDIIVRPIVTEDSMDMIQDKTYVFEVKKTANKIAIAQAMESVFGVKVAHVHTMRVKGKPKRMGQNSGYRASWKKAIVKLTPDSRGIEFFESMM